MAVGEAVHDREHDSGDSGGAAGSHWLKRRSAAAALRFLQPSGLPRLNEISINARVLAFTVLVSMISAVLFGLALAVSGRPRA